jgi:hypothetical protein
VIKKDFDKDEELMSSFHNNKVPFSVSASSLGNSASRNSMLNCLFELRYTFICIFSSVSQRGFTRLSGGNGVKSTHVRGYMSP